MSGIGLDNSHNPTPSIDADKQPTSVEEGVLDEDTASLINDLKKIRDENADEEKEDTPETPPPGWMSFEDVSEHIGRVLRYVYRRAYELNEEHPGMVKKFFSERSHQHINFLSPQGIEILMLENPPAPEGWLPISDAANEADIDLDTLKKAVSRIQKLSPQAVVDNVGTFPSEGRMVIHLSPSLVEIIKEQAHNPEFAANRWWTISEIADVVGKDRNAIINFAEKYRESHPEWIHDITKPLKYSEELVELIFEWAERFSEAEEGWMTVPEFVQSKGGERTNTQKVRGIIEQYRESHPEWFKHHAKNGIYTEYLAPELVEMLNSMGLEFTRRMGSKEKKALVEGLHASVEEILSGETLEAKQFQKLLSIFGNEQVVDLLFQFHPEYARLPLPYVKSIIGEYLGDFLLNQPDLNLDNIPMSEQYLSNLTLKEGLTELIKRDILHSFKSESESLTLSNVDNYLNEVRSKYEDIENLAVQDVLLDVRNYFEDVLAIHPPENMRQSLTENRNFPDINQSINIKELSDKHRLLIADEMGLGKSASAIMTKEILGLDQALVVLPSGVIEVWQDYLSDQLGQEGRADGYFKEGQAPSILTIQSPSDLEREDIADFDYILISQERLNGSYLHGLKGLKYQMLIVDEVHKLKNLKTGKRSAHIQELAGNIDGEEGEGYLALLSGTPIPNKVEDISISLKLLYPDRFASITNKELTNQIIRGDILDLRSLLMPRMQMKSVGENLEMPQLHEEVRYIKLSENERKIYDALVEDDEFTAAEKLQILRQFVLNPRMFDVTPDIERSKATMIGKELTIDFQENEKIVMFVNGYVEGVMRGDIDIYKDLGLPPDVDMYAIDGSVSKAQRLDIQKLLAQRGQKTLLVVSGQTADVGVDFSAADSLHFFNEPWSEYEMMQQRGRVYRPGLRHNLKSTRYIVGGTIEEGIHEYIQAKYKAIEKVLRGIPTSVLEKELLKQGEAQVEKNLEVNSALADKYLSGWDKMRRIFGYVKEIGEDKFKDFISQHGETYADSYSALGSRSYQANANRVVGAIIDNQVRERGQQAEELQMLDLASGPEMLKNHAPDQYTQSITSLDINSSHFSEGARAVAGSIVKLPVRDKSMDYVTITAGLHYTSLVPRKGDFERLETMEEINRVLKIGGRAVVSMIYSLDFKDKEKFYEAMASMGLRVVSSYSGTVTAGDNFESEVVTLEKIEDCSSDVLELSRRIGPAKMQGLKLRSTSKKIRNTKGVLVNYQLNGMDITLEANQRDKEVQDEENTIRSELESMKQTYGDIQNIPREEIIKAEAARILVLGRYRLFKSLSTTNGAIMVR